MDINESLQPIVAGLLDSLKGTIEQELRTKISDEIVKKIANTEVESIVSRLVEQYIAARVDKFNFVNASDEYLQKLIRQLTDQIDKTLVESANTQINNYITQKLAAVDINTVLGSIVQNKISGMLQTQSFPPGSISQASINFDGLILTGNEVKGGIIERFGSTGIEDRATRVQMTLMDHATAFEGPLWAPELKVKGNVTVDGTLFVNGDVDIDTPVFAKLVNQTSNEVRTYLNDEFFTGFSKIVFKQIQEDGLDLDKITQGGKEVIKGNQLGYHIIDTNIRRLGVVTDLQTAGENLLSDTLYVTNGRVGVNSMDPTAVLSVWDQEVEVVVTKHAQDTGYIGTPRSQRLIVGSNNKENIILDSDGSVEIENLRIGNTPMSSASTIPNYPAITGTIVWNESPNHGSAIGWVCLGATKWSSFGKVD